MKFVRVERRSRPRGFYLDPTEYLKELPRLRTELPVGAWNFTSNVDHYDFSGVRCVKNLTFSSLSMDGGADGLTVRVRFLPNKFKHDVGLTIVYRDVASCTIGDVFINGKSSTSKLVFRGDVQLDEILPHELGCSHEVGMIGGALFVICSDLEATWQASE